MCPPRRFTGRAIALAAVASLAGCADALTVHPVVMLEDPVPDVPSLTGQWRVADGVHEDTLTIDGLPQDTSQCREGRGDFRSGSDEFSSTRVCFVEFDGQLIAEVDVGTPTTGFFRQFLVRVEENRLEVCGMAPVWALFQALAKENPVGYSLETLQYTTREEEFYLLMVLISKPDEMREFLRTALPELASACDNKTSPGFEWVTFERVTEEEATSSDSE